MVQKIQMRLNGFIFYYIGHLKITGAIDQQILSNYIGFIEIFFLR